MADFCTECAPIMWGDEVKPDIDIVEIFNDLTPNSGISVLCEGCGLATIWKTPKGEMELAVVSENKINWMSIEDFRTIQRINI